jgi:Flp pilus assembly protein TadD
LKEGDNENVIKYANKLLQMNPDNVKILFRRGMAYTNMMEFEKAKEDLVKANKLEPQDKQVS